MTRTGYRHAYPAYAVYAARSILRRKKRFSAASCGLLSAHKYAKQKTIHEGWEWNDVSPDGDMMYLLRKYDATSYSRNDAMFALHVAKPTSLAKRHHLREVKHHGDTVREKSPCVSGIRRLRSKKHIEEEKGFVCQLLAGFSPHTSMQNKKPSTRDGFCFGDPYGNRTHVTAVKGPCLSLLTNGPYPNLLAEKYGSGDWT